MRPSLVGTHDKDHTVQRQVASRFNNQGQGLTLSAPSFFKSHAGKPPCRPAACVLRECHFLCFSGGRFGNKESAQFTFALVQKKMNDGIGDCWVKGTEYPVPCLQLLMGLQLVLNEELCEKEDNQSN